MEAKQKIKHLIEENIDPILNSFNEWEKFTNNLIKYGEKEKYFEKNPFENQKYEKSELFEQYSNIKKILNITCNRIEENINFINNYKISYQFLL